MVLGEKHGTNYLPCTKRITNDKEKRLPGDYPNNRL